MTTATLNDVLAELIGVCKYLSEVGPDEYESAVSATRSHLSEIIAQTDCVEALPEVIEFRKQAHSASYHHADDSMAEWHLAKPHQQRCQEIYDVASPNLKKHLAKIKGEYLISLRLEHGEQS